ncbi:MAG: tRNA 2-thiocytidine(32) synthetase TtcA [Deltaproteobacteria bacterium]|nr:tRNA 2-thiocytidine(32) synthetase TtcA [Deltaproteobacteria bacterium]
MAKAIADFGMIRDGDRILCAVSGGKDSMVMHRLLTDLARRAPVDFELVALTIDQGQPGFQGERLAAYMADHGYDHRFVEEDTYSIVKAKVAEDKMPCSLCSRLRRGILYRMARQLGCNKIALGHHRDDVIVTLMLNLMFGGQLSAMPPKLVCDEGDIVVIRPLAYCTEDDLAAYASEQALPVIPCAFCATQPGSQRRAVSELLAKLDAEHPGVRASMLAALRNVRPSQLWDAGLWSKLGLTVAADLADPEIRSEPAVGLTASPEAVPGGGRQNGRCSDGS